MPRARCWRGLRAQAATEVQFRAVPDDAASALRHCTRHAADQGEGEAAARGRHSIGSAVVETAGDQECRWRVLSRLSLAEVLSISDG